MRLAKTVRATVLAAITSIPLLGTAPTAATTVGVVEFAGTATLACPGLGYPATPLGTTDLSPNNCPFLFVSDICAKEIINVNKPGKPPATAGSGCSVVASGTVTGYCGLSYGQGEAIFEDNIGNVVNIPSFSFTDVAHTLVVTGVVEKRSTGQKGFLSGLVEAAGPTPVLTPSGGSCLTESATVITLAGAVSFTLT